MNPDRATFDLNDVRARCDKQPRASGGPGDARRGLAVCPFTIICDSREQLPYDFGGLLGADGKPLIVPTVVTGLASGDYSIQGMEDRIAIERKSLDDLYGSVTRGRERFEREITRLNELPGFAAVVIEASWAEIMAPAEHRPGWENRTDPRSVTGTILAWAIRYPGVWWFPAGNRRAAEVVTFGIMQRFWDEQQK